MSLLSTPLLCLRLSHEFKDRVTDFLLEKVSGLECVAESTYHPDGKRRPEIILLFGPAKDALEAVDAEVAKRPQRSTSWSCHVCTFLNSEPQGLFCKVCETPRSVLEWSGFGAAKAAPSRRHRYTVALAQCQKAVEALAKCAAIDRVLESGGVSIVTHLATDFDQLLSGFQAEMHGVEVPPTKSIRVRCKTGNSHVYSAIEVEGDIASTLSIQSASAAGSKDSAFLFGVYPTRLDYHEIATNNAPVNPYKDNAINRAYFKIKEVVDCSPLIAECLQHAADNAEQMTALDIGASPGGWTAFLAEKFDKVIAVDPGALDETVLARPNVTHIKSRLDSDMDMSKMDVDGVQKAVDTLEQIHQERIGKISLICCDINEYPNNAANIILRAAPLAADGCMLVLTLKLNWRGANAKRLRVDAAKEIVATYCDKIEEHHLFANTFQERTIVARFRGTETLSFTPADIEQVVNTRQRGLFVVIDGYAVGTNTAELEKLFLECHHFGVTHVFVIPAGEDTDAKDLAKFECLRLSKAYLLNVSFFATLADCLGTRHANVFTATSSPRTGAVGLYEASFVGGSSGAYVDASPTDDTTIVVSCASSTSTALATDTIEIDAASKLTSPQTLFVPFRGLARCHGVNNVTAAVLSEISRQREVSGRNFSLIPADQARLRKRLQVDTLLH